jgi:predicted Zn finger-like uncharacterized protein
VNLAARCPSCGTVFRVVQDQLRVSDGWVRCGRCSEVFNAIEGLVDLDEPDGALPPPVAATTRQVPPVEAPPARPQTPARAVEPVADAAVEREAAHAIAVTVEPPAFVEERPRPAPSADAVAPEQPAFVRRADRAARWRRPAVRAVLAVVVVLGLVALAAQATWVWRDMLAAREPALREPLAAACRALGCSLGPPRAIESLAVESSALVRVEGTPMVRLNLALRNRAPWAVAAPAVDLTLTDSQGGVVARRVLRDADFETAAPTVPPATVISLQTTLQAGDRAPAGYTIEIFYP